MNSRLIIADKQFSSVSKTFQVRAKETYRCAKGVFLTGSIAKPLGFAAVQISGELAKGVVYTQQAKL